MKTSLICTVLAVTVATPALAQTAAPAGEIKAPSNVFVVVLAPTGRELAAICDGNTLRTFSVPDGKLHLTIDGGGTQMMALAYSTDGKRIAVATAKGEVRLFDSETGAVLEALPPSSLVTYGIALSPDGRVLAVAPAENPVQLWDVEHRKLIGSLENPFSGSSALAFSPNGELLASADNDAVVRVYDVVTGKVHSRYDALLMEEHGRLGRDLRQIDDRRGGQDLRGRSSTPRRTADARKRGWECCEAVGHSLILLQLPRAAITNSGYA